MRWLLLKDLQILRRSPLLVGVLIGYSVLVSLLAGLALSSGPSKPTVAFANLVAPDDSEIALGGRRVDASQYADKLFEKVDPIRVKTREEAIEKVRSGEALGALVVPADVTQKLQGTLGLGGGGRPTVEVYYNAENPLKRQFVQDTINATLAEIGLPPLNRTKGPPPTSLPVAPVAIIWSPLPGGSPKVRGNLPGNYWPGMRWVDWVGTDFYSQFPVWKDLNHFYGGKQWKGKPFAVAEWGVYGKDEPRFAKQLVAWTAKRPRVSIGMNFPVFSARYTRIAPDSNTTSFSPSGPSGSTSAGIFPFGLIARNSGLLCSPAPRLTGITR